MRASGGTSLPDANVWLAVAFSDHLHHAKAKAWFGLQNDASCGFCRITQMALLRHLTNTKIMGQFVQSQQEAWRAFDKLANDPRVLFFAEPLTVETAFRNFSQANSPSHAGWTDSFLAALAVERRVQLVTFDQGFRRFSRLDLLVLG